jgi:hypothetical protein
MSLSSSSVGPEEIPQPQPRLGVYWLCSFDKAGFLSILEQLNGDDWFIHDPEKYDVETFIDVLDKSARGERIQVWMHAGGKSMASVLLQKIMTPAAKDEIGFLSGWISRVALQLYEAGKWRSSCKKQK